MSSEDYKTKVSTRWPHLQASNYRPN